MSKLYEKQKNLILVLSFDIEFNHFKDHLEFKPDNIKFLESCQKIHELFINEYNNELEKKLKAIKYNCKTTITEEQYNRLKNFDYDKLVQNTYTQTEECSCYYTECYCSPTPYTYIDFNFYIYETMEEYKIRKNIEKELRLKKKKEKELKQIKERSSDFVKLKMQISKLSDIDKQQIKDLLS